MRQPGRSLAASLHVTHDLTDSEELSAVLDMTADQDVVVILNDEVVELRDDVKGMYFIG